MLQPEKTVSISEYHGLLRQYEDKRQQFSELSYQKPDEVDPKNALKIELAALVDRYQTWLPNCLLARCPICGEEVWETIDTYSLNGIGWRNRRPDGFGWQSGTCYQTDCSHVQIVGYGVNLNGLLPDDVTQWVGVGSERPFVMKPLISLDGTFVVIHVLPVNRADGRTDAHYTLYFTTYFTENTDAFEAITQSFHEEYTMLVPGLGDYKLEPWIAKGKLYWLDTTQATLPLRNQSVDDFPYGDMEGVIGMWYISGGRLRLQYGPRNQEPRGHPPLGHQRGFLHRWWRARS